MLTPASLDVHLIILKEGISGNDDNFRTRPDATNMNSVFVKFKVSLLAMCTPCLNHS